MARIPEDQTVIRTIGRKSNQALQKCLHLRLQPISELRRNFSNGQLILQRPTAKFLGLPVKYPVLDVRYRARRYQWFDLVGEFLGIFEKSVQWSLLHRDKVWAGSYRDSNMRRMEKRYQRVCCSYIKGQALGKLCPSHIFKVSAGMLTMSLKHSPANTIVAGGLQRHFNKTLGRWAKQPCAPSIMAMQCCW